MKNFRKIHKPLGFLWFCIVASILAQTPKSAAVTQVQGKPQGKVATLSTPWLRVDGGLHHMRLDPKGRFVAYLGADGRRLAVADTRSKNIWTVSDNFVGGSFFWAPDGYRLFFREQLPSSTGKMLSRIKAFDCFLARSVVVSESEDKTGFLTLDPRDLRFHILGAKGISTRRIYFPGERLAGWQVAQRTESGKWLATPGGMLWVTQGGYQMRRLEDDGDSVESFDISPDGSAVAWASIGGQVFISQAGKKPRRIGPGRDPKWHPKRPLLLYAGGRMVGSVTASYDLRVTDSRGEGRFLTDTQYSSERWPQWHPNGDQVLYTIAKTTDVYLLDFKQ